MFRRSIPCWMLLLASILAPGESLAQSPAVPISATAHGDLIDIVFSGPVRVSCVSCIADEMTVQRSDGSKDFHADGATFENVFSSSGNILTVITVFSVEQGDDVVVTYVSGGEYQLRDDVTGEFIASFSLHALNTTGPPAVVPVSAVMEPDPSGNSLIVSLLMTGQVFGRTVGFTLRNLDGTKTLSTDLVRVPGYPPDLMVMRFPLESPLDPDERFVLHYSWGNVQDDHGNPVRGFSAFNVARWPPQPDFDGDGNVDLLWQSDATRQVELWSLGGPGGTAVDEKHWLAESGPSGWRLVSAADFDRDGTRDLLWQHDVSRHVVVTYLGGPDGLVPVLERPIATARTEGWTVAATADFNLDGTPDIVWQNDATREAVLWYMGGRRGDSLFAHRQVVPLGAAGWRIVAAVDFDVNVTPSIDTLSARVPDLVWQNDATGQVAVWFMGPLRGDRLLGQAWISDAPSDARVVGAGDFDRDGNVDLAWQRPATGQIDIWYLGGADRVTFLRQESIDEPGADGWRALVP